MKHKVVCTILVSMLLLFTMLSNGTQKVEAESTPVVYVDPENSYATLGQTFSVNVSIANVTDLYGFQFKLGYNTSILDIVEATIQPFLNEPTLVIRNEIYEDEGWYLLAMYTFGPSPGVNGSGPLVTLEFKVTDIGNCTLNLYYIEFVDSNADVIPLFVEDGYFEFTLLEHDIVAFLEGPGHLIPGDSALLNATVFNGGLNNETDVELQLLINGSLVDSVVIDFLQVGSSYTLSYLWTTAMVEATYNVTAYALPAPDETVTLNNMESAGVLVSYVIRVPFHFPTIQEAIDAASLGVTILVSAGETYYEHLTIDKSLMLVGEESSTPVIDGGGSGVVIRVRADNVIINGFVIRDGIYGIKVEWHDFTMVTGNTMLNNKGAITLEASDNNTVIGNRIKNNEVGIILLQSDFNTISSNIILDNENTGLALDWSYYNTISGNEISNHGSLGIHLEGSRKNTISDNTMSNSARGIYLHMSYHNTIKDNVITNNSYRGINLRTCSNNLISSNTVSDNGIGIEANYTENNVIYHNSFINNTQQVLLGHSNDTWDNGCEGNYWSDYAGEDLDGDGIGDTLLPHQGVDNCPLMSPYIEGDVNHDAVVSIVDGVIIGIAFGAKPGDPNWNPHADLNGDEIITIADIVLFAIHFGEKW